MKNSTKKILIAPLDWGLGHATRCIPLIQELVKSEKQIVIAGSGMSLRLLSVEFPNIEVLELPSYHINYNSNNMVLNMLKQTPKVWSTIKSEYDIIDSYLNDNDIDLIISDNRYGVYSKKVKSIFISHQLSIQMPKGLNLMKGIVNKFYKRLLKPFSEIWVPDLADFPNLSGALSHGLEIRKPLLYLGALSRFNNKLNSNVNIPLLVVLSGVEPQRTILEGIILEQLRNYDDRVVLVRGVVGDDKDIKHNISALEVYNYLGAKELELLIQSADKVVCRSGYSSIMDMTALGKKVLYIPTPGQTEQEYLAKYHKQNNWAEYVEQDKLDLIENLKLLENIKPLLVDNYLSRYLKQLIN